MITEKIIPLVEAIIDRKYIIVDNQNHKYTELGLYKGNEVNVLKTNDRSLILAVGASRYIISQKVAKKIMVVWNK